jgi:relish
MDKYSGICTGNEEVFLLCEKVNKKEIKIRFFEADVDGNQTWEAFANFTEADVHHQVAIVFRTPAYHDLNIDRSVQVYAQLFRPKDGEYSEPRPFTYKPKIDLEIVDKKRKKNSHFNADYSNEPFTEFSEQSRYYSQSVPTSQSDLNTNSSEANVVNYYGKYDSICFISQKALNPQT